MLPISHLKVLQLKLASLARFPGSQPVSFDYRTLDLLMQEECAFGPPNYFAEMLELTYALHRYQLLGLREV